MNIYTKTGDKGETSLLGKRVRKDCLEIKVLGDVDELNASLGVLISTVIARWPKPPSQSRGKQDCDDSKEPCNDGVIEKLKNIQHNLFVVGSNIASLDLKVGKVPNLKENDLMELENWIDLMEQDLEPLYNFILPGGNSGASQSFLARAVCRRAERNLISLKDEYNELDPLIQQYLNRLSDVLFVLARWLNKKDGVKDVIWEK